MDYRQVVQEQIDNLQDLQKKVITRGNDIESACKIAETILLLCREIRNIPPSN